MYGNHRLISKDQIHNIIFFRLIIELQPTPITILAPVHSVESDKAIQRSEFNGDGQHHRIVFKHPTV